MPSSNLGNLLEPYSPTPSALSILESLDLPPEDVLWGIGHFFSRVKSLESSVASEIITHAPTWLGRSKIAQKLPQNLEKTYAFLIRLGPTAKPGDISARTKRKKSTERIYLSKLVNLGVAVRKGVGKMAVFSLKTEKIV